MNLRAKEEERKKLPTAGEMHVEMNCLMKCFTASHGHLLIVFFFIIIYFFSISFNYLTFS